MNREISNLIKKFLNLDTDEQFFDLLENIKSVKNTMLNYSDSMNKSKVGSIIFDNKHKELGILIGPLDAFGIDKITKERKKKYYTTGGDLSEGETTFLVVSATSRYIIDNTAVANSCSKSPVNNDSEIYNNLFRVRYLKGKDIIRLDTDSLSNTELDIKEFCCNQCVMDCNSDCKLFKYKK